MPPLLLDIGAVPDEACDCALEDLFKALSTPAGPDIWRKHENPWLRQHVEDVTHRYQALLEALQDAFARLLLGEPIGELAKALPEWERWSQARMAEVRAELEAKLPAQYTLGDWMKAVDFLISRYLPADAALSLADYLTVRAAIAGKIQANMGGRVPTNAEAAGVISEIPARTAAADDLLSSVERQVVEFARARAADNISDLVETTRHRMKQIIIRHVEQQVLGIPGGTAAELRQDIFDTFGQLNRDMRRIAVTEAGECCNQGFIAAQRPGQKVKRTEAYQGACEFCRSINGKVLTVVDPDRPQKDGANEVWLGKTNIGRSASPRRRVGNALVERPAAERWWIAAGVQHPHCRGSWLPVSDYPPQVSREFRDWLEAAIAKAAPAAARGGERS